MPDSFSIIFGFSAVIALAWLGWAPSDFARQVEMPHRLMMAGLFTLVGGLLGARLLYVALHWRYFQIHLLESFAFWSGGLSGFGGVVGSIAGCWSYSRFLDRSFWGLADALARPAAIMSAALWSGCWLTYSAYGSPVAWGIIQPDIFGREAARWPVALMAAAASAVLGIVLPWLEQRMSDRPSGIVAGLSLAWLAIVMLGASLLRADPTILYGGIRQETWGAGILVVLAAAMLSFRMKTSKGVQHL
jgi:phosphatidylglycerol:prolipoprotein diacylglycerol transferase